MSRSNCFDLLRLAAAVAVLVGHSWILTTPGAAPRLANIPLHTLGVAVFFSISGYLISTSWTRSPQVTRYFSRRIRRIFPALIVVILITVFVVGPLTTTRTPTAYFTDPQTWQYLQNLALIGQYDLPGVFDGAQHSRQTVNGSLWTLGVEFCCYVGVAAVGIALRKATIPWTTLTCGALACAAAAVSFSAGLHSTAGETASMVCYFAVGALISLTSRRIALVPAMLAVATIWLAASYSVPWIGAAMSWLAIPLIVVVIGSHETKWGNLRDTIGDISYGTYLYGYLIQQLYVRAGATTYWDNLALAIPTTLAIATASWWFIERPALREPRRVPIGPRSTYAPLVRLDLRRSPEPQNALPKESDL